MIGFIRARTNRAVLQAEKKGPLLVAKVAALRDKPVIIKLFMEPDGYAAWIVQEREAVAAAKAAKGAAKEAGVVPDEPEPAGVTAVPEPAGGATNKAKGKQAVAAKAASKRKKHAIDSSDDDEEESEEEESEEEEEKAEL